MGKSLGTMPPHCFAIGNVLYLLLFFIYVNVMAVTVIENELKLFTDDSIENKLEFFPDDSY